MSKYATLLLITALTLSSLAAVEYAFAQIPKPSVPEFTLKYVDNSYDKEPAYGIDPYTGKIVLTQAGYHVQNRSVELIIRNQLYRSYRNENGSLVWLFYAVAIKGHFEKWTYADWDSQVINLKTYDSYPPGYLPSSDSEYTIVTYGLDGDNVTGWDISVSGQVDFRVQAIIGYSTRINETFYGPPIGLDPGDAYHYHIFAGQTSDWSNTQTITITTSVPSFTQTETMIGVAVAVAVGGLVYWKKRKR